MNRDARTAWNRSHGVGKSMRDGVGDRKKYQQILEFVLRDVSQEMAAKASGLTMYTRLPARGVVDGPEDADVEGERDLQAG